MPSYTAPTRDTRFIINEMLDLESYAELPGFEAASADVTDAVINEGGKFCAEVLAPINQSGDQEGCTRHEDGSVTAPKGFKEAFDQFREAGWGTLSQPEEFGGQGMPHVLGFAFEEFVSSANQAFGMYPGLTNGAVSALLAKGSQEQKEKYLPKMISNEWTGTMNLTEPHCGRSGMIRTKAEPRPNTTMRSRAMVFILAGEHDMADNILPSFSRPRRARQHQGHLLFVVPSSSSGRWLDRRNGVDTVRSNKMGIRQCHLRVGDGAEGWLVGEEKGRRAVHHGDRRVSAWASRNSQAEVVTRTQWPMRSIGAGASRRSGTRTRLTRSSCIDVRRMLMDAKAFTEGMRALCLWGALQVDLTHGPRRKGATRHVDRAADPCHQGLRHRQGL